MARGLPQSGEDWAVGNIIGSMFPNRQKNGETKLPTVVSLVVLVAATVFGWYWVWGLSYFYWAVQSLGVGEAFLVQTTNERARDQTVTLPGVLALRQRRTACMPHVSGPAVST